MVQPMEEALANALAGASRVYIANFGISNCLWDRCREQRQIQMFGLRSELPFIQNDDPKGFVDHVMQYSKTTRGVLPTKSVASKWFGVSRNVMGTLGDLWIHRAGDKIWWAISSSDSYEVDANPRDVPEELGPDPIFLISKPTYGWNSLNAMGSALLWEAMHAKARHFLATESTMQQLSPDNAAYALAMTRGESLESWHSRLDWKVLADKRRGAVQVASPLDMMVATMAMTAMNTTTYSNGQQVQTTSKNKDFLFSDQVEMEAYIRRLLNEQEGLCAISGLALQYDQNVLDKSMLCSLDRIDSDGHYEKGNLQVVCRFINKWKSDQDDQEFRRLLEILRRWEPVDQATTYVSN